MLVSVRGQLLLDQIDPHAAVVIDIGAVVTLVVGGGLPPMMNFRIMTF